MTRNVAIWLVLIAAKLVAQETVVLETNPASTKWYQIKTSGFKILYQPGFAQQAQRMANTLETIREPEAKGMKSLPRRIPLILQSQSSISNAFVTLAPRRSEFFTMPPQNYNYVDGTEWLTRLATHEYRHMAQFQRSITGFNKLLFYAFGQEAASGLAFLTAPQWFWEGDAVASETSFSHGGRGRMPHFDLIWRANLLEGRKYSYNKQYLLSYKNFVPNHYVLGYHMVSYMRKQAGRADVWGDIAGKAWSFPLPFAFSIAMKKYGGQRVVPFYNSMMADLKANYENDLSKLTLTPFEVVTPRTSETYTDYLYPQMLDDGSLVALKSGIGDISQVIVFDEGKDPKQKFVTGLLNEVGYLSASGKKVVWNEYRFDPRWPVKNFSVVQGFDFGTHLKHQVTQKSRYAGAAISPDGSRILTVETDTSYRTSLLILDYSTGKILKRLDNPDQAFYSMARWAEGGQSIVSLKSIQGRKSVVLIDYQSFTEKEIFTSAYINIGHPVMAGQYLLYNSPFSGIDNIYALNTQTGKQFQVTCAKYGAYNPCLSNDGKTLYYNNQGRIGMDIVKTPFDPTSWKPIEDVVKSLFNTYSHLIQQEAHEDLLDSIPQKVYETTRYHKIPRMLNPHSWGAYVNNSLTRVNIGITSKDILSTTQIKAGYEADIQERTGSWKATVSMQALYPILDFTFIQSNRKSNYGLIDYDKIIGSGNNADTVSASGDLSFSWKERILEGGLRIPFNLTHSRFYTSASISTYFSQTLVTNFVNSIDGQGRIVPNNYPQYFFRSLQDNGSLLSQSFQLNVSNLLKRSTRDINSKWGQAFFLDARNSLTKSDFSAKNFSFTGYLFFPGLFKHHSFWGYWAYQSKDFNWQRSDSYLFRNYIPLPRGLSTGAAEKTYSMSANYTMPVWYPDFAVGPVLNIKRVRLNGFADYAYTSNPQLRSLAPDRVTTASYLSVGGEMKFDINVFRFLPELDLGFRYSRGIQPSANRFEFLLGTFNF